MNPGASHRQAGERPAHFYDVIIIGAGAAGMMCAAQAGQRGRRVLLLDHAVKAGEKIRISGGGRCNFTNLGCGPGNFLSGNPHFCKSALSRYTPQDFLALVEQYGIGWYEKTLGQLFCDDSSQQIIDMLRAEMVRGGVELRLQCHAGKIARTENGFSLKVGRVDGKRNLVAGSGESTLTCTSLVVATGGKSIPKMGATGFGYELARQFGLPLRETRAGLVPLTFDPQQKEMLAALAGVSVEAVVQCGKVRFAESLLFTHRGLSGPAILQISSYWREGQPLQLALQPALDVKALLMQARTDSPRQSPQNVLGQHFPRRLVASRMQGVSGFGHGTGAKKAQKINMADLSNARMTQLANVFQNWQLTPTGTEGYRTAEVTLGGVDTKELDSKTMQARKVEGLYFIGEVVDVTGWLGGYNFQWAWSSGWVAGQVV